MIKRFSTYLNEINFFQPKFVILVETQKQYDFLMDLLDSKGYVWNNNYKMRQHPNVFDQYENFCLFLDNKRVCYGSLEHYRDYIHKDFRDYIFLTTEEFIKDSDKMIEEWKKKKEEKRLRYLEVDPYGEENWDE